jgi:hypothetical protein
VLFFLLKGTFDPDTLAVKITKVCNEKERSRGGSQ